MASSFGTSLRVSVFGQSHSAAVGCVLEGLPSGIKIDLVELQAFMARRAPGQGPWTTPRKESDVPEIVSGLNSQGQSCGAPLCAIIRNTNTRSRDYDNLLHVPRPGHADFSAEMKWHGNQDIPGGGHFSGRLTAPLCIAGGITKQYLESKSVHVDAHLLSCGNAYDEPFTVLDSSEIGLKELEAQLSVLRKRHARKDFPTIQAGAGEVMLEEINRARMERDSVGGIIECVITGCPAGIGSPMFDGLENMFARALFGIPAVKGVEFGRGFDVAHMRGSQNNDPYRVEHGQIKAVTNNAGGILGGISTGAPLVVRVAMKPTSSIPRVQDSVDVKTRSNTELEVHGRHDPCVATRAVPVVEAVCALVMLDAWLSFPPESASDTTGFSFEPTTEQATQEADEPQEKLAPTLNFVPKHSTSQ